MAHSVRVTATWTSEHDFEFDTEQEADAFREKVNRGGDEGLSAIVDEGDVESSTAALTDFEAS